MKKNKFKLILITTVLLIIFIIVAFNNSIKIRNYNIDSDKITSDVKTLLITDLHSCLYGKNQKDLIAKINKQNPDIILFGGDICDDIIPNDNTEILLKAIADKYPCYYVTGNHEYWSNDIDTILNLFTSNGVTVLNYGVDTININGQTINICGITDPDIVKYTASTLSINEQLEAISDTDTTNYTILLAHRPELIDTYLQFDYDLILSGHAHGGQFRIPFLLNGLFAPNQGFFPKYAGGRYDFDDTTFIVSRGLAKETTRIPRIFNPPELVVINLK